MPLPSSRMTKQPSKPVRYFPGKAYAEDAVSDEEEDSAEEEEAPAPKLPAPKATSFPKKVTADRLDRQALPRASATEKADDLEGFVTASESSDGDDGEESGSGDGDSSEEEESSSDDEPKRPLLAPKFISKAKRALKETSTVSAEQHAAEEERKRREKADELLQAQIERDAAIRKAGKTYWDDDDVAIEGDADDTDNLDPEAEKASWKLRELKRVQRDRQALIAKEQEREEIERRRNMTAEEREAEDREHLEKQAEEREGKGKMAFMQKYHHKGAFFQSEDHDEEVQAALNRDVAGRKFVDESDKSVLPEFMRIRDMTKLGKKGRTKYKDLKNEDTGRWGHFDGRRRENDGLDERFKPDDGRAGGKERTGANAAPVGERRQREDDDGREEKRPRYQ